MTNAAVLPGAYGAEPGSEMEVSPEVSNLVHSQVAALLMSSPAFQQLPTSEQAQMSENLEKIASYSAELIRDDWIQSQKLGQTPMVRKLRTTEFDQVEPALVSDSNPTLVRPTAAQAMNAAEFSPRAANNVARVTEATLNAIAFPTFVADLISGTFNAIVDASIQQMEAFGELLSNVAKTVDEFMADNVSDNNARDYVVGAFPRNFQVDTSGQDGRVSQVNELNEDEASRLRRSLNVPEDADIENIEEVVIPAARRRLAQTRQQMLSSMVLMGINRVIVTRGRIKAQMGFRIDTRDAATASASNSFDFKNETQTKFSSFLSPVSASSKTSIAYVSSSQKDSETEIDVSANLTGEVDLQFKSDVFPLERFADAGVITTIQGNTPNPSANAPVTSSSS
ncbi:MAG: hypothetical protein QNI90_13385 [Dinoroseobacter sp.]|nr:hypothetical protein [Dinoroseobacter sp.]